MSCRLRLSCSWLTMFLGVLSAPALLNDTGITACGDAQSNDLPCPVADYPGQDAEYGRDATHYDDRDGHAGFSFTKLDANGDDLPSSTADWVCVHDNITGLTWEVKTIDGGLRDQYWTYTWYNPDDTVNGGDPGTEDGGNCFQAGHCDTEKYVADVNVLINGVPGSHWRLRTTSASTASSTANSPPTIKPICVRQVAMC